MFNNIYDPLYVSVNQEEPKRFYAMIDQLKAEMQNPELAQYEWLVSVLKIFLINASRLKVSQHQEVQKTRFQNQRAVYPANLERCDRQHFKTNHSASNNASLLNITPKALAKLSKTQ